MSAPSVTAAARRGTLRRLLSFIGPFRWWIAAGVLLGFATVGSSVGLMAVSAYLISKAAVALDVTQLSLAIAGVRLFALSRAAFRYGERYVSHLATFRILTALRVWFYRAIEPLAPAVLQQQHSGDLLARIGADIETLENFYVRAVAPPLVAVLVTVLACSIVGSFDPWLAVVLAAFLGLTGGLLPWASRVLSSRHAAAGVAQRSELSIAAVDMVQGAADLIAFGQTGAQRARLLAHSAAQQHAEEHLAVIRGLHGALAALFTGLAGVAVLCVAIPRVSAGEIDGVFLALLPLTAIAAFEAVQPLGQAFQMLESSRASAARLFSLADASPAVAEPIQPLPPPAAESLCIRNLHFRYPATGDGRDSAPVFDEVSFDLRAGARLAITGASGAGKSTLAALLLRFWDADAGEILIDGRSLREYSADDVRGLIALVPQAPHLFHTTIRENLLVASPDASEEELIAACTLAQIHEFIASLPHGYDTLVGENGMKLSGGERQRLSIARAILKNAPILILDEATTHLDARTAAEVRLGLQQHMQGRMVLIFEHEVSPHWHVDRVMRLTHGRLIEQQMAI